MSAQDARGPEDHESSEPRASGLLKLTAKQKNMGGPSC